MRALAVPVLAIAGLVACAGVPDPVGPPLLEPLWVAEGFAAPEGVALAPDGNYLISNVVGEGGEKDGNGYVSKVSPQGDLIERYWAAKLNGPKGMAVHDGKLYVADIDAVLVIDAEKGGLGDKIRVDSAKFLNDVTVWDGKVLVSDSGTGNIIEIVDGAAKLWFHDDARFGGINGLLGDGDRLLISTMTTGSLYALTADKVFTDIATGMENADGIGLVPGGGYLVSSWPGEIHYAAEDGTVTTLLDTTEAGVLQNDLTVFGDVVIVPNWEPGTVTAWKIVR
ncbi:MAG: hypothetical protein R3C13_14470 [Hyphomonas sp.]|uniref:hypothetical protein n=1 Tax=Hyphomonas sp. TaxID=87 RepID=UPI003527E766